MEFLRETLGSKTVVFRGSLVMGLVNFPVRNHSFIAALSYVNPSRTKKNLNENFDIQKFFDRLKRIRYLRKSLFEYFFLTIQNCPSVLYFCKRKRGVGGSSQTQYFVGGLRLANSGPLGTYFPD